MKLISIKTGLKLLILLIISAGVLTAQDSTFTDANGKQIPKEFLKRITLEFKDVSFTDALHKIAAAGEFFINFNENIIPSSRKISINIKNKPSIIALIEILRGTSIDFVITKSNQLVLLKISSSQLNRNKEYTISGYLTEANSGEAIIGTNIFIYELGTGGTTNAYGFYSITVPQGYYTIKFSYIGYHTEEYFISLFKNLTLNVELKKESIEVDTVVVISEFEKDFVQSTQMGTISLNPVSMSNIPYLLGEKDILKTLHLLPGVTFGREGDAGYYVRGGEFDQNLTLLDEAPIYSTFHSFGFFSVFNPDAIKNITLIKGASPPKYGGRLSSVLDIQMNEGNMKEFAGVAGLGIIFSRFALQGPLIEDKSSYFISGRRTYLDIFKIFNPGAENFDFYFYDLNAKINYKLSNTDRLYLSGYFGSDVMGITEDFQMSWGNTTGTLRWNHLFNDKLFLNSSLIYSRFKHETVIGGENANDDNVSILSKINDITFKEDFEYFMNTQNTFTFGMNYIYHSFLPGQVSIKGDNIYNFIIGKRNADEASLYASHELTFFDKFEIDYGFRATLFSVTGEADKFSISDIEDSPILDLHENEKADYFRFEPRLTLSYQLNKSSSVKAGYSVNHQYLHMLSNAISGTPFDVWQPSSGRVKPQRSDQTSLGYFKNFERGEYEISTEIYYKDLSDIIDLRDGADLFLKNYFESELVFGKGWAYGIEFYIKKNFGNLTGWIGYSISKSERKIDEINNGKPYPSKYDRTHDLSIVTSYNLSSSWGLSANWVYSSGYNITLPYGKYNVDDKAVEVFTDRNGYRLPAYHRLDLGVSYTNSLGGTWNFSLYNAYARENTYMISIKNSDTERNRKEAIAYSFFSIVPSISYTLKF